MPSPSGKAEACKASILGSNPSGTSNIETSRPFWPLLLAPFRSRFVVSSTCSPSETSQALDYLEAGQPLSEFLEDFPTVSREQAVAALEQAKEALLARARPA